MPRTARPQPEVLDEEGKTPESVEDIEAQEPQGMARRGEV